MYPIWKTQEKKKRLKKVEHSVVWDNVNQSNIHVVGISEGEKMDRKKLKKW